MKHQILICGAGIVGLASALALARRGQCVTVLASCVVPPVAQPDHYHVRVYAISPASQRFLAWLGVWDALPPARLMPVQTMEIQGDGHGQVNLNAWQAALPQLAWIVEASEIERGLMQAVKMMGITWLQDRCVGYREGSLSTESGTVLRAELFVGADGAASPLRAAAGLAHKAISYNDTGLITHLTTEHRHQGTAFQWFREDGVLALLPLPDTAEGSQVSMVWSMRTERARTLEALAPAAQAATLQSWLTHAAQNRLGQLRVHSPPQSFPLTLEQSQIVAPGIALVGDAAHRLHPLAGQGLNLGLGDAEALAQVVAERELYREAGDLRVLRRYRRARAESALALRLATDGLHKLFGSQTAPLVWLRNTGMQWVNAMPSVKRQLILRASAN